MKREYFFCIADFCISLSADDNVRIDEFLPSFHSFRCDIPQNDNIILRCEILLLNDCMKEDFDGNIIDETVNEMGTIRLLEHERGYMIALKSYLQSCWHYMLADKGFTSVRTYIGTDEENAGQALSSLLRIAFSQSILKYQAISIHAAAVYTSNRAYLFMGESGTGKSTHARLWMEHIPGTRLLNDDNPVVRLTDDGIRVHGTPWSGKTDCYKKLSFYIGGIVRLKQSPHNFFTSLYEVDAFVSVYPGCSVLACDDQLRNSLYDTLVNICQKIPVGVLECRPDGDAALLCYNKFNS